MKKKSGATIKIKGPALNNYFAKELVKEYGPNEARERTSGPMREAVERVIAAQAAGSAA